MTFNLAAAAERWAYDRAVEKLVDFAGGKIDHEWSEDCPSVWDHDTRDQRCTVCLALMMIEAHQESHHGGH